MKKVIMMLAIAAAIVAVSSCKNNKAPEAEAECVEACCDSCKAACDSCKAACDSCCQAYCDSCKVAE